MFCFRLGQVRSGQVIYTRRFNGSASICQMMPPVAQVFSNELYSNDSSESNSSDSNSGSRGDKN